MSSSSPHTKSPERVAAGLKATIKNPHVSEEAKQHAAERLEEMKSSELHGQHSQRSAAESQSAEPQGGDATEMNTSSFSEVKEHTTVVFSDQASAERSHREILKEAYPEFEDESSKSSGQHMSRVLAGHKAALHNPNVSQEAKAHARQFLEDHDAL